MVFLFSVSVTGQSSGFEINGKVKNSGKGNKFYLTYKTTDKVVIDSFEIKSNSVIMKGEIEFPVKAFISNNKEFILDGINGEVIYLEPKKATLELNYKNLRDLQIKSFRTYDEYNDLVKLKKSLFVESDSIYKLLKLNNEALSLAKGDKSNLEANAIKIDQMIDSNRLKNMEFDLKFVADNKNSYVSPDLLLSWIKRREGALRYERIDSLFNLLGDKVKESYASHEFKKVIKQLKSSKVGENASGFDLIDINHNHIKLDSFKGQKVILLDFWASWCAPCREDFPFLKELSNKYRENGFEIVSISKDQDLESWKKAIKKDGIENWKHIAIKDNIENNTYHSDIEKDYFVTTIPVKILINKDGKIIGRWRGGGDDNKKDLTESLSKVF
ncbi:TlpA disulfide reductase family protein [Flavobacterium hercynium]|nr:TlpA disulfide reductase family protein [Flavobacterium hercynium]